MKILVLNGPNLNMLGQREPEVYGSLTLEDIERELTEHALELKVEVEFFQSNHEGALIDAIQDGAAQYDAAIFNPGGFTHTSVALRDALLAVGMKFVELHLSNVAAREEFRHHSYFSDIALGTITGFGAEGYKMALSGLVAKFKG